MKVAAIPLNIAWGSPERNLAAVESMLSRLQPGTDIVVLPELFSTGFIQDYDALTTMAESASGNTMRTIAELARRYNVAIAGSYTRRVSQKIYNHGFFIEPSGEETGYDKRHLFSISPEHELCASGDERPPIIRFRGWNISMIICYDLRFPVWCRNRHGAYDIMLVPANWPNARAFAWTQLLSARAIENQAYYVGANRSGNDDFGNYDNSTVIVDPMGRQIGETDADTGVVYADFSHDELDKSRERLPFLKDADDFGFY